MRLVNAKTFSLVNEWKSEKRINVVGCNHSQIVLSQGSNLVHLEVEGKELKEVSCKTLEHEVACIDVTPLTGEKSPLVAVGMWTDISVNLYQLPSLEFKSKVPLGGQIIPRSVLFTRLEEEDYLFVGMGDGYLSHFKFDSNSFSLSNKKTVSLATQPITLQPFKTNGVTNVFAACDRPTVVYSSNKKILYSNVNLTVNIHFHQPFFWDSDLIVY